MGMNVNLTPQLEELVRAKVSSGMYSSASEVVREGLRLIDGQDRFRQVKLDDLRLWTLRPQDAFATVCTACA